MVTGEDDNRVTPDLIPRARTALVQTICANIAAALERIGTDPAASIGTFAPAGAAWIEAHAAQIVRHLIPTMHKTKAGGLASGIIPIEDGDARLFAEGGLRNWRLERVAGGIEAAGASPLSLLEFLLPDEFQASAWLEVIGLAFVLAIDTPGEVA